MNYAGWKGRKPIATALKADTARLDAPGTAIVLSELEEGSWGRRYSAITRSAANDLHNHDRECEQYASCPRDHFPSDEIWLQLREIAKDWKMPAREWRTAKAQFALLFGDRFETSH